jgi:hypothetical protein
LALNNQIKLYAIDTAFFYNEDELKIHKKMRSLHTYRKKLTAILDKTQDDLFKTKLLLKIKRTNNKLRKFKLSLVEILKSNKKLRYLNPDMLHDKKIVAMFESSLTRAMGLKKDDFTKDIFIVQTYFFNVIEDIILNGFIFEGEKYVCFTASAGQIRTKKTVFVKESILNELSPTLMCGLTIEAINRNGGININKYLAYLALNSSATDLWHDFDISKAIVVDDMETKVTGIVDFICDKTYNVKRKEMDVEINHTDGCGMILPSKSKKNFMVRLPWVKGLLVSFPFDKFIETYENGKIKDIYGVEHDVLDEQIEVIFTKSQFKMYQYYKSWGEYVENFKRYNCQAGICNEEEDFFDNAKINYQMLQTLTDFTDDELLKLAEPTNSHISKIGSDRATMLRLLGVTKGNSKKNHLQKALEIYPELLEDEHCKEIIKQTKKKLVKEGRAGKLSINGKYTFISPDLYAFCEYLFMGDKNPKGLLLDGEVFCNLYPNEPKLDCLRSPHLYREHAIRKNVIDQTKSEWFVTNALYVSSHDLISKLIMCDFDGDTSLVVADQTILQVAERNMKDIVPLYYNMAKAGKMDLNMQSIYYGLKMAYTGGNIGMISNDISKIWNSEKVDMSVIKLLCMENNHVID